MNAKILIFFGLLALGSSARAGTKLPMATGQADAAFASAMAAHQTDIANFLDLPCVTDTGKATVTSLQAGTAQALADTQSEYADYMAFVTKPMEGNGKCDGGFNGVEVESGRRHDRSVQASQRVFDIETAYHAQTMANLFDPVITYNDSGGEDCMKSAGVLYDALEAGTKTVKAQFDQLRQAMSYEAERFAAFQAQNRALRISCGDTPSEGNKTVRSVGEGSGKRAPASPGRKSENGASSITGVEEDAAKRSKADSP